MPEHLRALTVILGIAFVVFYLAKGPLTAAVFTEAEFKRYRNCWLLVTLVTFFSYDFWTFMIVGGFLLFLIGANEHRVLALYCVLLFAFPHGFRGTIPGFGGINMLIDMDYIRLLNLTILLPFAIRLRLRKDKEQRQFQLPDTLLMLYSLLVVAMYAEGNNFTATLRSTVELILDVWLPYYVASRALRNTEDFRAIAGGLVLTIVICAAIGMFETVRFWWLYDSLRAPLNIDYTAAYLIREDTNLLRAKAATGHAIVLGYVTMIGLCFLGLLFSHVQSRFKLWLAGAAMIGGLVASLSRGPWVGAAFALFILFVLNMKLTKRAIVWMNLGIVGLGVMFSPAGRVIIDFLPFVGTVGADNITYRQQLWNTSLRVITQNPWFGDIDFMRNPILEEMRQGQGIIDIVNSYLQYALEFGLVGLGLFLLLILVVLRGVWRTRSAARKSNDIEVAILGRTLLAAMGGILVTIATVSSIFSIPALYWLIIGACVAYIRQFGYKHLQANTETARPYGQPRSEDKHAITPAGQSL